MKFNFITVATLFVLMTSALTWQGCDKDDPDSDCNIPNADLSYTKNIKAIIDQQCISCHVSGNGVGAPGDYSTYEGMKTRLDNGKIHDRVVVKKDMPQGSGMSQGQRDSINCWIAAGFPK